MVNAMSDLKRASDKIKARGGVHEWHEECEYDFQRRVWERATTGEGRKSNLTPTRDILRWHRGRRAREKGAYSKGLWAMPEDSVNVNTSGYEFEKHHGGWEKYVEDLEEEAENWKMDWELDEHLRENGLAHLVSAGKADDEGAGILSENFLGVD
jgi:hypothetical protein